MTDLLVQARRLNGLGDRTTAEPFAGGAGAALSMLFREETPDICVNDADTAIYAFWASVTQHGDDFLKRIEDVDLSIEEWERQREVYRSDSSTEFERGFATFYLNRCNRSGVITNGGPIGGYDQTGKWGIDARFNRSDLSRRCGRVAEYRERIIVSNEDGMAFIKGLDAARTFFFVDPPYFHKGASLYLNTAGSGYHRDLASLLASMQDAAWILTYDDCPEIRALYDGWAAVRPFSLRYVANARRQGRELMITPKWMRLPENQKSSSIVW